MNPSWRKPFGIFLILFLILVWSIIVATLADYLQGWPWPLLLIFFILTGLIWILPLKPLIHWMETGRWRP